MALCIKVHKSYRTVVALCDSEILGKKFEEGIKQLDVRESFYNGESIEEDEAVRELQRQAREDATFNIVGEKSVNVAIKSEVISEGCVGKIDNIPFALKLI